MDSLNNPMEWYLFDLNVSDILGYIEQRTGKAYAPVPSSASEANKWHVALREGLRSNLHLNVGMPGVEEPVHPIEENEAALIAALLLGIPTLRVIISGEWEVAVRSGLISREQLTAHENALEMALKA